MFEKGRWRWAAAAPEAGEAICPACRRIRDDYPAGLLTLRGAFVARNRDEILGLARNNETLENRTHPLNRIMSIEDGDGEMLIRTTDIHLPRRIGDALKHAYKGDLSFAYDEDGYFIRALWQRDD